MAKRHPVNKDGGSLAAWLAERRPRIALKLFVGRETLQHKPRSAHSASSSLANADGTLFVLWNRTSLRNVALSLT